MGGCQECGCSVHRAFHADRCVRAILLVDGVLQPPGCCCGDGVLLQGGRGNQGLPCRPICICICRTCCCCCRTWCKACRSGAKESSEDDDAGAPGGGLFD